MLHFDQSKWNVNETCHRAVDVVGIATIEFTKHYTHPIYGEYDLKYYWTGEKRVQYRIRIKAGITLCASLYSASLYSPQEVPGQLLSPAEYKPRAG